MGLKVLAFDLEGCGAPSYAMRDCVSAFKRLGHKVDLIKERVVYIDERLKRSLPDLFFTINHLYLNPELLSILYSMKIPCISWFIDNPFFRVRRESLIYSMNEYCILFVCDRVYVKRLLESGFKNVYYLPLATNPDIFRKMELTKEEIERFRCKISFTGSSMYTDFSKYLKNDKEDPKTHLYNEVIRIQSENPFLDISDILEAFQMALDDSFKMSLEEASAALIRKDIIERLSLEFEIDVYGDDGWKLLCKDARFNFRGGIINKKELPKLYNASMINLNITKPQSKTSIPPRVFDVLACEGFLISDYRRDLGGLFELNKELVSYRTKDELSYLIRYFLDHPEERLAIGEEGRKRILREHKYEDRIKTILDTFYKIFG